MRKSLTLLPCGTKKNSAVTIIEAIVAMSILAAIVAVGFAALLRSYTISSEARNIDAARNMLNTLADQFLSMPYRDPSDPFGDEIMPICVETDAPTGAGIEVPAGTDNGPLGEDLDGDGFAGMDTGAGLVVTLYEGEHVEEPVDGDPNIDDLRAVITRHVTELEDGQLGPLLEATFTIEFRSVASGTSIRKTLTVARAVVDQ